MFRVSGCTTCAEVLPPTISLLFAPPWLSIFQFSSLNRLFEKAQTVLCSGDAQKSWLRRRLNPLLRHKAQPMVWWVHNLTRHGKPAVRRGLAQGHSKESTQERIQIFVSSVNHTGNEKNPYIMNIMKRSNSFTFNRFLQWNHCAIFLTHTKAHLLKTTKLNPRENTLERSDSPEQTVKEVLIQEQTKMSWNSECWSK